MVQVCSFTLAGWPTTASLCLLFQALLLVELPQGLDQLAERSGDDRIELVEIQIDPVIGNAILRKIVGANALAAVAGADQGTPLFGPFPMELLLLHFVEPATEDAQSALIVF